MDNRAGNGGAREGSGRKPKAAEQNLIEKLSPLEKSAFKALKIALKEQEAWAVKLYFDYKFGKAKETKDITVISEQPLFELPEKK